MSLRKTLSTLVAISVPIVLYSANAIQSRAQSQGENASANSPLYKMVSVKPNKSGIPWETITIKPNQLIVKNETLYALIRAAYKVEGDQISGAPDWLSSEHYDIRATVDTSPTFGAPVGSEQENEHMLQALLSDRFKLAVHHETKQIPVYELVLAEDGPNLRESTPAYGGSDARVIQVESGRITGREVPIATLAKILSEQLGRPVLDKTGLLNHYDVTLQLEANSELSGPAISAALQEQLGLKLESQQISREFLVIDHVETPSAE
jgi:uncharacterized protein (TIGR03435 family)